MQLESDIKSKIFKLDNVESIVKTQLLTVISKGYNHKNFYQYNGHLHIIRRVSMTFVYDTYIKPFIIFYLMLNVVFIGKAFVEYFIFIYLFYLFK